MAIIGRQKEQRLLNDILTSKKAEFTAIYGRRRVGKTYLITEFFSHKKCLFLYIVGMKDGSLEDQLLHFTQAVLATFNPGLTLTDYHFSSWEAAFAQLTSLISHIPKNQKIVLFFDELPWLATPRSKMLQALEYYWNRHWSRDPRIKLIVCGSAASWMLTKIVHNKGGLHNRITQAIRLAPFTLAETKDYLHYLGIPYNQQQTLEIYMAIGGIPHYLGLLKKGLSPAQNINLACFQVDAKLKDEFEDLFSSLFEESAAHEEIIRLIASKRSGLSRTQLAKTATLSKDGGRLSSRLRELEAAGFITSQPSCGKQHPILYKMIDEYTLFYLTWIAPIRHKKIGQSYWEECASSPHYFAWAGLAFESVCEKHLAAIRTALAIPDTSFAYSWQYRAKKNTDDNGAQIDLLFDRNDNIVTVCEIKYTQKPFSIDKEYAKKLSNKINIFKKKSGCKKEIFLAMISAAGLKPTPYSAELISNEATLEDLF